MTAYKFGQNSNTTVNTEIAETKLPTNLVVNKAQPVSISNNSQPPNSINLPAVSQNAPSVPSNINVSGEMYIITKGRQNIKLAAVEICAVPENTILNWISAKRQGAVNGRNEAEKRLRALQSQKVQNAKQPQSDDISDRYQNETKNINLDYEINIAKIHVQYWGSAEYYLEGLNQCEYKTKTDSDGKYILNLPSGKKYALAAQTDRQIMDSKETYWWLLWANQQMPQQTIVFSNDNLMTRNPPEKVIQIQTFSMQ